MDNKKLKNLIRKEEGIKLDFKQKIDIDTESGKKELAKDVCAIANSKGGRGYILIGIEDKTKKVIGVNIEEIKEEQIQQIISSRCEPPIPISLDFVTYGEKYIGVISIYDGSQKPYQLRENGAFYIRRGSTTDTMRKEELISALEESLSLHAENCPILHSRITHLDMDVVRQYFTSKGIIISTDNEHELMESAGILFTDRDTGKQVVTLGGLLIFSSMNSIYTPHNMIRIINKINRHFDEVILVTGRLLDMIDQVEKLLYHILPKGYPIYAICEAVKNAVLYRDYTIYYKEIEVLLNYKSITVISPGTFAMGREIQSHHYVRRNMWIYEKLIALDNKKRFIKSGRGFSRMKKAFKGYGKVIFTSTKDNSSFKVIFPGLDKVKLKSEGAFAPSDC